MPARLIVSDYDDLGWVEVVEFKIRAIQMALRTDVGSLQLNEGEDNLAAYSFEGAEGELEIKPEWVGKTIYLEVAPSLVADMADDLAAVCDKWDATPA